MDELKSLISLLIILIVIYAHRKISLDIYRQKLFNIRFQLFLLPYKYKNFNYDSEIYREYELKINNNIRFAHRASFFSILFFGLYIKGDLEKYQKKQAIIKKQKKLKIKNKNLLKDLEQLDININNQTIFYFAKTSLTFYIYMIYKILKLIRFNEFRNIKLLNKVIKKIELPDQVTESIYILGSN